MSDSGLIVEWRADNFAPGPVELIFDRLADAVAFCDGKDATFAWGTRIQRADDSRTVRRGRVVELYGRYITTWET